MRTLVISGKLCPDGTSEPETEWVPMEEYARLREAARKVVEAEEAYGKAVGRTAMDEAYWKFTGALRALRDALGKGKDG